MSETGNVKYETQNEICTLTFYHPKSNSLPGYLLRDLARRITEAGNDNNVKLIIIKSEGEKSFCAGASFDELISLTDFETSKNFFLGFALVINAARKCPKFILGRIHGKAVGGAVGLISVCDYALALEAASLRLSEIALGIGPFVIAPAVERKIGKANFAAMTIDHEWRTSGWAKSVGLYNAVYPTINELDEAVLILSEKLRNTNPDAMKKLKAMFWEGTDNWDDLLEKQAEISGELVLSKFTRNYIKEFKEKLK